MFESLTVPSLIVCASALVDLTSTLHRMAFLRRSDPAWFILAVAWQTILLSQGGGAVVSKVQIQVSAGLPKLCLLVGFMLILTSYWQ